MPIGELTQEKLHDLILYDTESGIVTWKARKRKYFNRDQDWNRWNSRFSGMRCGTDHGNGYLVITFDSKNYYLHRVIWMFITGDWPVADIDHRNRERSDNRLENLRSVSRSENLLNTGLKSSNTSGVKGVCWSKSNKKWFARFKSTSLGMYDNFEDAVNARKAAEDEDSFYEGI